MPSFSNILTTTNDQNPLIYIEQNRLRGHGIFQIAAARFTIPPLLRGVGYMAVVHGHNQPTQDTEIYIYNGPGIPNPSDPTSTILETDWTDESNWIRVPNFSDIPDAVSSVEWGNVLGPPNIVNSLGGLSGDITLNSTSTQLLIAPDEDSSTVSFTIPNIQITDSSVSAETDTKKYVPVYDSVNKKIKNSGITIESIEGNETFVYDNVYINGDSISESSDGSIRIDKVVSSVESNFSGSVEINNTIIPALEANGNDSEKILSVSYNSTSGKYTLVPKVENTGPSIDLVGDLALGSVATFNSENTIEFFDDVQIGLNYFKAYDALFSYNDTNQTTTVSASNGSLDFDNVTFNGYLTLPDTAPAVNGYVLYGNNNGTTYWGAPPDGGTGNPTVGVLSFNEDTGHIVLESSDTISVSGADGTYSSSIDFSGFTTDDITQGQTNLFYNQDSFDESINAWQEENSDLFITEGQSLIISGVANLYNSIPYYGIDTETPDILSFYSPANSNALGINITIPEATVSNLNNIGNVSISNVTDGQGITWDGSNWVNSNVASVAYVDDAVSDVQVSASWNDLADTIPPNVESVANGQYVSSIDGLTGAVGLVNGIGVSITHVNDNDIQISLNLDDVVDGATQLDALNDVVITEGQASENQFLVSDDTGTFHNVDLLIPANQNIEDLELSTFVDEAVLDESAYGRLLLVKEATGWKKLPFESINIALAQYLQTYLTDLGVDTFSGTGNAPGDIDGDGFVSTNDLLAFLGLFGSTIAEFEFSALAEYPLSFNVQTLQGISWDAITTDFSSSITDLEILVLFIFNSRVKIPDGINFEFISEAVSADTTFEILSSEYNSAIIDEFKILDLSAQMYYSGAFPYYLYLQYDFDYQSQVETTVKFLVLLKWSYTFEEGGAQDVLKLYHLDYEFSAGQGGDGIYFRLDSFNQLNPNGWTSEDVLSDTETTASHNVVFPKNIFFDSVISQDGANSISARAFMIPKYDEQYQLVSLDPNNISFGIKKA